MNSANGLVGVGCFAGEATLSRVLRRIIESYRLGEVAEALREQAGASGGSRALDDLMAGQESGGQERVAGFFLAFKDRGINLALFTRRGGLSCTKFSTSIDMG